MLVASVVSKVCTLGVHLCVAVKSGLVALTLLPPGCEVDSFGPGTAVCGVGNLSLERAGG